MKFLQSEVDSFKITEEHELEAKAEKRNSRGRCWAGTWNNPKMSDEEFESHLQSLYDLELLQYAIFQREVGEKKGTPHFQFFINFKTPQYFSKVKTKLLPPGCHFAPMISNANRCKEYCSKVDTRVSGPYEIGEFQEERQRTDLNRAIKMIDEGISFEMVSRIFPSQSLMYSRQLKERERMILEEKQKEVFRKLNVTYIYGQAGTGKTRYVMEKYGYDKVYRVTSYDSRAFDGYKNEKVILFDEFRSSFKISDMLNYLDGYPLRLPCRYNDKVACFTEVYIISNIPLSKQYENVQENEPETYNALMRRIHNVIKFDSTGQHIQKSKELGIQLELIELPLDAPDANSLPF